MTTKYWVIIYAPFQEAPFQASKRFAWLPIGTVVEILNDGGDLAEDVYFQVEYAGKIGYIRSDYLEPYRENLPVHPFIIDNQTPIKSDFEQYMLIPGANGVQVNMCGQLCIAFTLGHKSFSPLLEKWRVEAPGLWKTLLGTKGRFSGTGYGQLQEIYKLFGVQTQLMTDMTRRPSVNRSIYTPESMKVLCDKGYPLVGVKIDGATGRLRGQGIGHWVVVTEVVPERTGYGLVYLYNPAPHRIEVYAWEQFMGSAVTPSGIYMPKEQSRGSFVAGISR